VVSWQSLAWDSRLTRQSFFYFLQKGLRVVFAHMLDGRIFDGKPIEGESVEDLHHQDDPVGQEFVNDFRKKQELGDEKEKNQEKGYQ
jgi:hypothetical protein